MQLKPPLTNFMQKQLIYNKEEGMALVFCLMAVLLMSLISTALLKVQYEVNQVSNTIINTKTAHDATDFCLQGAFYKLKADSDAGTLTTSTALINITNYANNYINSAFSNSYARPTQSIQRVSNRAKFTVTCTLQFIKEEADPNASGSGSITATRSYGTSATDTIKYYRLFSVSDNSRERVEYQTIIAI